MHSLRLYDGDMNVIIRKHHEIDIKLYETGSTLTAIVQEVHASLKDHMTQKINKAYSILGIIKRNIIYVYG